jgi:hypothetical protein
VNPGSEPERDDTGLPPVDIEIPDDARELDRDIQAYYREVRAQRRRVRSSRIRGAMTRDGIALPLLACCLIFALIIGTLLTVFTASGIDQGQPGASHGTSPGAFAPGSTGMGSVPSAGSTGQTPALHQVTQALPDANMIIDGKSEPLQSLRPAVFLLVPANCQCATALDQLASLFRQHVQTLLVAANPSAAELAGAELAGAKLATDPAGALDSFRHPSLTAVMVAANGSVEYSDGLKAGDNLGILLETVAA